MTMAVICIMGVGDLKGYKCLVKMNLVDGFTAKEALYQGTMGARLGPSFWDIVLINNHYNCTLT
jgi:hypothetical protein